MEKPDKSENADLELTPEEEARMDELVDEQVGITLKKFESHVPRDSTDEMLLLKAHLLAEYCLNHILALFKRDCNTAKLSFKEKLDMVSALGEDGRPESDTLRAADALNKIRNEMAHELEFRLTESHVDSLGFPYGKDYISRKFARKDVDKTSLLKYVLYKIFVGLYRSIAVELTSEIMVQERAEKAKKEK